MSESPIASPMHFDTEIAVVGGGLAGLTAAWQLAAAGRQVTLLEARSRLGGRVLTTPAPPFDTVPWIDLGPAWFWPHQQHMRALIAHFGLTPFEQYRRGLARYEAGDRQAPESFDASGQADRSFRLAGGLSALVRAVQAAAQDAPTPMVVRLDSVVSTVTMQHNAVRITGNGFTATAGRVVMAAPPRVVLRDIAFDPPLADALRSLLADTVTWMGHAMKCVATYDTPFWRDAGRSGYAVSWGGPLQEIHDASMPAHDDRPAGHALMGFVAPRTSAAARAFRESSLEVRRITVLRQLARLFGDDALNACGYVEYDWAHDPLSCGPLDDMPPAVHPEYGHALFTAAAADDAFNGRLVWAGTETSEIGGGYLEGAVASGMRVAQTIISSTPASST